MLALKHSWFSSRCTGFSHFFLRISGYIFNQAILQSQRLDHIIQPPDKCCCFGRTAGGSLLLLCLLLNFSPASFFSRTSSFNWKWCWIPPSLLEVPLQSRTSTLYSPSCKEASNWSKQTKRKCRWWITNKGSLFSRRKNYRRWRLPPSERRNM